MNGKENQKTGSEMTYKISLVRVGNNKMHRSYTRAVAQPPRQRNIIGVDKTAPILGPAKMTSLYSRTMAS